MSVVLLFFPRCHYVNKNVHIVNLLLFNLLLKIGWLAACRLYSVADFGILFVITAPSNSNHSQLYRLDALNLCDKLMRFNYARTNFVRRKITHYFCNESFLGVNGIWNRWLFVCLFIHFACVSHFIDNFNSFCFRNNAPFSFLCSLR